MLQQSLIREFQNKDTINHFFLLKKLEIKQTKAGKDYLVLELLDKSGTISGNYWEGFEEFLKNAFIGAIVRVKGSVEIFNERVQLRIESAEINNNNQIEISDFLPTSKRDIDEMKNEFWKRVKKIQNKWLQQVIKIIFNQERFEKFSFAPAGKSFHHSYIGGLLEHTLEIIRICDLMCDIHSELNRDLLITAAILHDVGKTEELSFETVFDYTDKGRLIGHIVFAANWIYSACKQIPNFPEELETLLLHLVLSHQGKLENASPVEPKTIEAIVLYYADELSAKTNAYKLHIESEGETNSNWTKFHHLIQSALYIPKNQDYNQSNQLEQKKDSQKNSENESHGKTLFD